MKKKVILVRLDKIGDLVSTLPVDQLLNPAEYDVLWVIQKGMGFICDHAVPRRKYIELDKNNPRQAQADFKKVLKEFAPDIGVSFQAPWWASWQLFLTGTPLRAGVRSQWHSFLFLNSGVRQKRSQALVHEAQYNADLLINALSLKAADAPVLELKAQGSDSQLLSGHQLETKKYIVVHPGMAGSAKNWPENYYVQFISGIIEKFPVVITGTPADEVYLAQIKQHFTTESRVRILQNKLKAHELLQVLANAHSVLAPSTGVAHLAAALGTKVVCPFSPIRVQQSKRWAPRGKTVLTMTPKVSCEQQFRCAGSVCKDFDCMKLISVEEIKHACL